MMDNEALSVVRADITRTALVLRALASLRTNRDDKLSYNAAYEGETQGALFLELLESEREMVKALGATAKKRTEGEAEQ